MSAAVPKISGQQIRSPADLAMMSVVLAQPHRRASREIDPMDESALGRFCKRTWRSPDTRAARYWAGEAYARVVDNERVSKGLQPRGRWDASMFSAPQDRTSEEFAEWQADCKRELADNDAMIRYVDDKTVRVLRALCWEDRDIPEMDWGRAEHGLYRLSILHRTERR